MNTVSDQSNSNYDAGNDIIYNIEVWKFNLCDFSDAYILVTVDITVVAIHAIQQAFKNCASFIKCTTVWWDSNRT